MFNFNVNDFDKQKKVCYQIKKALKDKIFIKERDKKMKNKGNVRIFKGLTINIFLLGLVSLFTDLSSQMVFPLIPLFLTTVLGAGAFAVGIVDNHEIDEINILNASFLAMHRAVDQLQQTPELLLIDGNRFKAYPDIPHECIIKGDAKFLSIAAASILAKTYRDEFMFAAHEKHSEYAWNRNKGYPTKAHREAIRKVGTTNLHRMTFRLLPEQLEFDI